MGYERNDRGYGRDAYRSEADRGYDRGDPRDRGFFERAGDEVRSWFGDEEAERRRRYDERFDDRYDRERGYGRSDYPRYDRSNQAGYGQSGYGQSGYGRSSYGQSSDTSRGYAGGGASGSYPSGEGRAYGQDSGYGSGRDAGYRGGGSGGNWREDEYRALYGSGERGSQGRDRDARHDDPHGYHSWREQQVSSFDRDYDEYRRENQSRFASEFSAWRENRQGQRNSLRQAREHQEVVGSDGAHVGKVDHVRGDRILLTKTDKDAGGHHHSIPSSWIQSVDDKVHLSKTAEQAQQAWRDEETNRGLFSDHVRNDDTGDRGPADLNRSFSGTY